MSRVEETMSQERGIYMWAWFCAIWGDDLGLKPQGRILGAPMGFGGVGLREDLPYFPMGWQGDRFCIWRSPLVDFRMSECRWPQADWLWHATHSSADGILSRLGI